MPRIDAIGRDVEEWVGKDANSAVPLAVKLRVLRRYNNCCYLSGQLIGPKDKWDVEHILPLGLDGSGNRERNLAPAIKAPHSEKTKADLRRIRKADRQARAHYGLKSKPKGRSLTHPTLKRKVGGSVVQREPRP